MDKKVTDDDKVLAAEVAEKGVTFEFEGETYEIPPAKKWPLRVQRAQERGRMLQAVEELLGKQFRKFDPNDERTMEDLDNLLTAMFEAIEVDPKA